MRIIHFSDLHYGKHNDRIERMLPILTKELDAINVEKRIDLIVLSGDLVWTGENEKNFEIVQKEFINPLLSKLNISQDSFILTQGNHENSKDEKELSLVKEHIDRFEKNDEVDSFVSKDDEQFNLSFVKSENYFNFVKSFYKNDDINKLYQVFKRKIDGKKIGIVSFNSSWRAFIGNHANKLLIPKSIVNKAIKKIKDCNIKIAVIHHPIEDLKDFNQFEIEDIIHEQFHVLTSGHYHKHKPSILFSTNTGILKLSSMALMSNKDGSENGLTLLDFDLDTFDVKIKKYRYINSDNTFTVTQDYSSHIPMNEEKEREVKVYKQTKQLYEKTLIDANSLVIFNKKERAEKDFLDYYNDPIIKDKSYFENIEKNNISKNNISLNTLVSDNYIIFGKDKTGKTSLLRKIQLELLNSYFIYKAIPVYIEFKNSYTITNFDITDYIRQNYFLNKSDADALLKNEKFHFLIDNYNPDSKQQTDLLTSLLKVVSNSTTTITSFETQESLAYNQTFKLNGSLFSKAFIHPLNRSSIRTQTEKVLDEYEKDEKEKIVNKVLSIFSQLNIPYNYWSLSLFLWIYKKDHGININDNIEMIILYVDKLLGREEIAALGQDDYDLFKKFFANLSHKLLKYHSKTNYSITYGELTEYIEKFKKENIRFVTDTKDLLDYLLEKGILRKNTYTERYTFRLNGVMEYFTSVYMQTNKSFVDDLMTKENDMVYLEFANELEILSGLGRSDRKFLEKIFNKTKDALKIITEKYDEKYDDLLSSKMSNAKELAQLFCNVDVKEQVPVSLEEQDEMMDNIKPIQTFQDEVKVKAPQKKERNYTHSQLERHLFILSRVFRSMSSIDDENLMIETFEFIINSYINLGFELISEFEFQKEKSTKEIEKEIISLLTSFTPLVTQLMISDAVLHVNLKRLIHKKIDELEKNKTNNEFKLLLLYFMLLDIDLKKNKKIIEKIIENIDVNALKNTALLKLYLYLNFKSHGNKDLEGFLKDKIVELQKEIYPDTDENKLRNKIDKKLLITKRQQ
jgi:predicted MPP superfamily phosphohydrolase